MKKKVLFALIALFSFVSAWAVTGVDVSIGTTDYTVNLSKQLTLIGVDTQLVPTVNGVKKGSTAITTFTTGVVYNATRSAIVDQVTEVGNYFLEVKAGDKLIYVPFQVGKLATNGTEYDFVCDEASWNASMNGRGLALYHSTYESKDTPQYFDYGWWHDDMFTKMYDGQDPNDGWGLNFTRNWVSAINCIDRSWPERTQDGDHTKLKTDDYAGEPDADAAAYAALVPGTPSETWKESGYPWVVFFFPTTETAQYKPVFRYNNGANSLEDESLLDIDGFSVGQGKRFACVSGIFKNGNDYPLWLNVNNKTGVVDADNPYPDFQPDANTGKGTFDLAKFQVILLPAEEANADLAEVIEWTLSPASVDYDGNPHSPLISIYVNGQESDAYTYRFYTDAACTQVIGEADMINAATYYAKIGKQTEITPGVPGQDTEYGFEPIGDAKTFQIKQAKMIITPAYVYKMYGQPDPEKPNFEKTSGQDMSEEERDAIMKVVWFKRVEEEGNDGENKGMYKYFIDVDRDQSENNYDVVVTHNSSFLIIDPVSVTLSIAEPAMSKTYGDVDPNFKNNLTISVPESVYKYVRSYPLAEDYEAPTLTEEEQEIYDAEFAAMQTIFNNITITREEGEDVKYDETVDPRVIVGYNFIATQSEGLLALGNFKLITKDLGQFVINPYDISQDEDNRFQITFDDVTYNGNNQRTLPKKYVKFQHNVYNQAIDVYGIRYAENSDAVVDPDDYDAEDYDDYGYTIKLGAIKNGGSYYNVKVVTRNENGIVQKAGRCDLTGINNFTGTKSGFYAIKPIELVVTFDDKTKVYGQGDEALTYKVTVGAGEDAPEFTAAQQTAIGLTINPVRETGEDVGEYAITEGEDAVAYVGNYNVTYVPGTYTITNNEGLIIYADNKQKLYGDDDPDWTYTVTNATSVDDENAIKTYLNAITGLMSRTTGEDVGEYTIKFDKQPAKINNYDKITYVNGTLTIDPVAGKLIIVAKDQSKTYGQLDPDFNDAADGVDYEAFLLVDAEEEDAEPTREPYTLPEDVDIYVYRREGEDATRSPQLINMKENVTPYPIFVEGPKVTEIVDEEEVETDENAPIGNYIPTYVNGVFNIDKATLHVNVKTTPTKYGKTPQYDLEPQEYNVGKTTTTDLKNNDQWIGNSGIYAQIRQTAPGVAYSGYPIYEVDEDGNYVYDKDNNLIIAQDGPGDYTISATGPEEINNYIVYYNDGTLSVTASGLYIWALNQDVNYPTPGDRVYVKPTAVLEPTVGVSIGVLDTENVLPENFDYSTLVELSCTATKVGTNKDAITITKKAGVKNYDVTIDNPETKDVVDGDKADLRVIGLPEIHLAYENVDQALEDHKGQEEMTVFLPNRKLTAGLWYTFSLPFEFRVPDLSNKMYYGVADILDEAANDGNFHFVNTSGRIEANQPFLYKAEAADEKAEVAVTADELEAISFTGVTIAAEDEDGNEFIYNDLAETPYREDAAGNKFIAQYTGVAKADFAADERVFGLNGEGGYQFGTPTKAIAPTVAFIGGVNTAASADVRIFIQEADGTVTEISAVDAAVDAEFAEGWYTITGIKLDAKPTEKGVYIYNGKKVSIQ